jgi:hypothetical protein
MRVHKQSVHIGGTKQKVHMSVYIYSLAAVHMYLVFNTFECYVSVARCLLLGTAKRF